MNANHTETVVGGKTHDGSLLQRLFSIDIRALVLFRIGVALIIFFDILVRFSDVTAHYTDSGVMPRTIGSWLWELYPHASFMTPFFWGGSAVFVAAMFFLIMALSVLLLIGYRTRVVSFLLWWLLISLHARNPLVDNLGDVLLPLLCFWGIFLPLGAKYSYQETHADPEEVAAYPRTIFSIGSIAILFQTWSVYVTTAIAKLHGADWRTGEAVYRVLRIDSYATYIGSFVGRAIPHVITKFISYAVLALELVGPFVLVSFQKTIRIVAVMAFVSMLVGFSLFLRIGVFATATAVATLLFLPPRFFDMVYAWLDKKRNKGSTLYYDGLCSCCARRIRLLKMVLMLEEDEVYAIDSGHALYQDMRTQHSWIAITDAGDRRYQFGAFVELLGMSPVGWVLFPFFRNKGIPHVGDVIYRRIACKRVCDMPVRAYTALDVRVWHRKVLDACAGVACVLIIISNIANFYKPTPLYDAVITFTGLRQAWNMFAPNPFQEDGWYVIVGVTEEGREIDLRSGGAVSWGRPARIGRAYPNVRWVNYMIAMRNFGDRVAMPYGRYMCRQWNEHIEYGERVAYAYVYSFNGKISIDADEQPAKKTVLWEGACS